MLTFRPGILFGRDAKPLLIHQKLFLYRTAPLVRSLSLSSSHLLLTSSLPSTMQSFGTMYASVTALLLSFALVHAAVVPEEQNWAWALEPIDTGYNLSRRSFEPFNPLAAPNPDINDDFTLHGLSDSEVAAHKHATSETTLNKAVALSTSAGE